MARVITSPVEKFPGTITLCEPLTLAQCHAISIAFETISIPTESISEKAYARARDTLNALNLCSEKWEIRGQPEKPTEETFIASPVGPANLLLSWAFGELSQIYFGEYKVPNA